jgi:DNA-binding CsgD family transcriptional regulator
MSRLTPREREVVTLLGQGMRPTQIAAALCVSHSTVKTHVAHVREKTGASSTLELAVQAARSGAAQGNGQ